MEPLLIVYIIWTVIVGLWAWNVSRKNYALNTLADSLELYGQKIDDWERDIRVQRTAVDGLVTYARRLAPAHPELEKYMDTLEEEMFDENDKGEESLQVC